MSNSSAWSYYVLIRLLSLNQNIFRDKALRQLLRTKKKSTVIPIARIRLPLIAECNASSFVDIFIVDQMGETINKWSARGNSSLKMQMNPELYFKWSTWIFRPLFVLCSGWMREIWVPTEDAVPFSHLIFRQPHRSPSFLSWTFPAVKFSSRVM